MRGTTGDGTRDSFTSILANLGALKMNLLEGSGVAGVNGRFEIQKTIDVTWPLEPRKGQKQGTTAKGIDSI